MPQKKQVMQKFYEEFHGRVQTEKIITDTVADILETEEYQEVGHLQAFFADIVDVDSSIQKAIEIWLIDQNDPIAIETMIDEVKIDFTKPCLAVIAKSDDKKATMLWDVLLKMISPDIDELKDAGIKVDKNIFSLLLEKNKTTPEDLLRAFLDDIDLQSTEGVKQLVDALQRDEDLRIDFADDS